MAQADEWLNGGLRRDGLHEFFAATRDDGGAAMAMALLLAHLSRQENRPLIWLRRGITLKMQPYGPGLHDLGIDPNSLILLQLPDWEALLRASTDCVRHGSAAAVILEIQGHCPLFDLTASRRLTLAAERSGTMVLVTRHQVQPVPSSAHTRWEVAAAPSMPLPANAPGLPVFDLRLLRQRGGRDGLHVQLEWDREQAVFRTPLLRSTSAFSAGRAADQRRHRAA
ncbi:hypothetical protein D6851_00450 [Altericroceibacterium spongiae]|uniref:Protein ImuA n=1 Tax=Altericroceibacterium spongiae TaxID=2320269 RepID=A0A420EQU8_9SPHN|nr:hypothetical protein D6851_00450 [Altericroceibacterium spongiae]